MVKNCKHFDDPTGICMDIQAAASCRSVRMDPSIELAESAVNPHCIIDLFLLVV